MELEPPREDVISQLLYSIETHAIEYRHSPYDQLLGFRADIQSFKKRMSLSPEEWQKDYYLVDKMALFLSHYDLYLLPYAAKIQALLLQFSDLLKQLYLVNTYSQKEAPFSLGRTLHSALDTLVANLDNSATISASQATILNYRAVIPERLWQANETVIGIIERISKIGAFRIIGGNDFYMGLFDVGGQSAVKWDSQPRKMPTNDIEAPTIQVTTANSLSWMQQHFNQFDWQVNSLAPVYSPPKLGLPSIFQQIFSLVGSTPDSQKLPLRFRREVRSIADRILAVIEAEQRCFLADYLHALKLKWPLLFQYLDFPTGGSNTALHLDKQEVASTQACLQAYYNKSSELVAGSFLSIQSIAGRTYLSAASADLVVGNDNELCMDKPSIDNSIRWSLAKQRGIFIPLFNDVLPYACMTASVAGVKLLIPEYQVIHILDQGESHCHFSQTGAVSYCFQGDNIRVYQHISPLLVGDGGMDETTDTKPMNKLIVIRQGCCVYALLAVVLSRYTSAVKVDLQANIPNLASLWHTEEGDLATEYTPLSLGQADVTEVKTVFKVPAVMTADVICGLVEGEKISIQKSLITDIVSSTSVHFVSLLAKKSKTDALDYVIVKNKAYRLLNPEDCAAQSKGYVGQMVLLEWGEVRLAVFFSTLELIKNTVITPTTTPNTQWRGVPILMIQGIDNANMKYINDQCL